MSFANRAECEQLAEIWRLSGQLPQVGSIAPTILEWATGGTRNCSSGRACAILYAALCGAHVPIRSITACLDTTRRAWFIRAMVEEATESWEGDNAGLEAIWRAHPDLKAQAEAARAAWDQKEAALAQAART